MVALDVTDADAEVLANLFRQQGLLPPVDSATQLGRNLRIWALALTMFAVYEAFVITFIIAFSVGNAALFVGLGWLIDACFFLDLLLNFRTTFFTPEVELIFDRKLIARRYIRGALVLDALALMPFEVLAAPFVGIETATFKACRVNRLLRVLRLHTVHAGQISRLSRVRRLVIIWACLLLLSHWSACV